MNYVGDYLYKISNRKVNRLDLFKIIKVNGISMVVKYIGTEEKLLDGFGNIYSFDSIKDTFNIKICNQ